jgi:hypothetical protein
MRRLTTQTITGVLAIEDITRSVMLTMGCAEYAQTIEQRAQKMHNQKSKRSMFFLSKMNGVPSKVRMIGHALQIRGMWAFSLV